MTKAILIYLCAINVITYITYGVDKYKAVHHNWRIPESTLMFMGVIGGALGALCAMFSFHHKIRKNKFRFGLPVILFLQVALYMYLTGR